MDLLTFRMHHYFTNPALITSQDTHPLTLLQPQTQIKSLYFSFFSHAVAIWNSYLILVCLRKALLIITYHFSVCKTIVLQGSTNFLSLLRWY